MKKTKQCFLFLAALYAILQVISAFFLVNPKSHNVTEESHSSREMTSITLSKNPPKADKVSSLVLQSKSKASNTSIKIEREKPVHFKPKQLLFQKNFYLLWVMFLFSGQGVVTVSTLYKAYGFGFITSDRFLAVTGAIGSLSNALGRILWSSLADRLSFRVCCTRVKLSIKNLLLPRI